MSPSFKMLIGLAVTALSAWIFHGPAGYGARLLARLDAQVQPLVARQELPEVRAGFTRDPMSRRLEFSGPANDFQRQRFVELIQEANIIGIKSVGWNPRSPAANTPPPTLPSPAAPSPDAPSADATSVPNQPPSTGARP